MGDITRIRTLTAHLRTAILAGRYPPGMHLSEYALARELDASRTPIHNALAALQQEDLVVYREHRGYAVRSLTYDEVQARLRVRATMEGLAARIVANQGLQVSERLELKGAHAECLDIATRHPIPRGADMTQYLQAVERFYHCLRHATGNQLLLDTIGRSQYFPVRNDDGTGAVWVEHETYVTRQIPALIIPHANLDRTRILDAIAEGNGVRAETLTREHMFTISQGIEKLARHVYGA